LPSALRKDSKIQTVSIGPETSKALKALGLKPTAEAKVHTIDGLVETLMRQASR
jgi:uroporphyrinogen-III synthase